MVQQLAAEFVCFVGTPEAATIWFWHALENPRCFGQCICHVKLNISFLWDFCYIRQGFTSFFFKFWIDWWWKDKMQCVKYYNETNWRNYMQKSGSLFYSHMHYFNFLELKSRSYKESCQYWSSSLGVSDPNNQNYIIQERYRGYSGAFFYLTLLYKNRIVVFLILDETN